MACWLRLLYTFEGALWEVVSMHYFYAVIKSNHLCKYLCELYKIDLTCTLKINPGKLYITIKFKKNEEA